jgi:hypothetical protein
MTDQTFDTHAMSDLQIMDLLSLGLSSSDDPRGLVEKFRDLVQMPSAELLELTRDRLDDRDLSFEQAAQLMGISELTLRRWFESSEPLSSDATAKLTGLCLLLAFAEGDADDPDAARLVDAAVNSLRKEPQRPGPDLLESTSALVASAFGLAGIMAAALHAAVSAECPEEQARQNR